MSIPRNLSIIADTLNADGTFFTITDTGNLTFTGTGNRITGDFSNGTFANRAAFQTSTANSNTNILALPNGTGVASGWNAFNNPDPTNASYIRIIVNSSSYTALESGITGTGTYLPMTFYTGGSERMRLDTSGNLGVGTSTVSYKLTLQETGGSTFNREYVLRNGDQSNFWRLSQGRNLAATTSGIPTNAAFIVTENGGGYGASAGLALGTIESAPLLAITAGVERMRIDSSGNVGIGTSAPTGKLDVRTAAATSAVMNLTSGSNATQTKFNIGQTGAVDWDVGISVTVGDFYIGGLGGSVAQAYRITRSGTAVDNHTWNTSGTERMRIDSSGNVGIGTSSPGTYGRFAVVSNGDYAPSATFISNSSAANWARVDWDNVNVAYNGIIYQDQSGLFNIRNDGANAIAFSTDGGNERMRIGATGNVGIGTSGPTCTLDVVSDGAAFALTCRGRSLDEIGIVRFMNNAGSTEYARLDSRPGDFRVQTTANNPLLFLTNSTERARIDTSGNVLVTSAAGLGYGTGSGGTVTQATSKSTAVTLNKPTGQITMNNAAMLTNTTEVFTVTNSLCAFIDTVSMNHRNGANYNVWVVPGIGSFDVYLKNISASTLSDAVTLNFSIIKGATS